MKHEKMKNLSVPSTLFSQYFVCQLLITIFLVGQVSTIQSQCFETVTFNSPGESVFTIPAVSANYIIEIEARGADGGDFVWGTNAPSNGGQGATIKSSYLVPASSELLVLVGASGFDGSGTAAGGGGGGSAVIIDNSEVLLVASAGGGGGFTTNGQGGLANINSPAQGGNALEASGGGGFNESGMDGNSSTGGGEGSLLGIGAGGLGSQDAGSGGVGFGGGGGGFNDSGGGGGGYKGGDGGQPGDFEGKAGDSYMTELFSGSLILGTPGVDGDGTNTDGFVIISCIPVTLVELEVVTFEHPLCFDDLSGSIEVMANSGLAPYSYSLNGGIFGDNNVFTDLSSGDYLITVIDALGNTSSVNVTLINPPLLVNTFLSSTDNTCFGAFEGSIEIVGTGGTNSNGYSYSINGGPVQSSGLFTNLANGFYVISVMDDNGCESQVTGDITSPEDLVIIATNLVNATCSGNSDGSASVFVMGGVPGYTFGIDGGAFDVFDTFTSLSGGLHTVSVMDSNGCIETTSFNIEEPDLIQIIADVVDVNCSGDSTGMISVSATGGNSGYQFSINGALENTIGVYYNLVAATYSIQVTDMNGCSSFLDVEVSESLPLDLISVSNTPASCGEEGQVIFDLVGAQGTVLYSVNGIEGTSNIFGLPAGIYLATAYDSTGCTASLQFEINQLSDLAIGLVNQKNVNCFGGTDGSVSLSTEGGEGPIVYSLDGETAVALSMFDNLSAGNYIFTATDSLSCSASLLVTILEPEVLTIEALSILDVACFGDGTGGVSFNISGGIEPYTLASTSGEVIVDSSSVSITSLIGGDFNFSVIDSLGCMLDDTLIIAENPPLQISIDSVASVNCAEGTMGYVSLSATGGAPAYVFEYGSESSDGIFEELVANNYEFLVKDSLGCAMSTEVNIGMLGSLIIAGTGFSDVSCFGGDDGLFVLNIPNHIGVIDWRIDGVSNPDSNFTNLLAGQYTLTATDSFECTIELEIEINEPNELRGDVINFNGGDGNGNGSITVLADGGTEPYAYSIDNFTFQASPMFENLAEGDYIITIVDANGCEVKVDQTITDVFNPVFERLSISPNPAYNVLNINEVSGVMDHMKIQVLDMNGRLVNTSKPIYIQNSTSIDIKDLPIGTYFIKIIDAEDFIVKRFTKI